MSMEDILIHKAEEYLNAHDFRDEEAEKLDGVEAVVVKLFHLAVNEGDTTAARLLMEMAKEGGENDEA